MKRRYNSNAQLWPATKSGVGLWDGATTQGLVMLFSELSAKSVGFEGLGFFTVTYGHIGSVSNHETLSKAETEVSLCLVANLMLIFRFSASF